MMDRNKGIQQVAIALGLILLAFAGNIWSQEVVYKPYKNLQFWSEADTLKLGATFTRTSNRPVTVRLRGNEAGWTGDLYFRLPRTGERVYLFNNHSTNFNWIDLSQYDIRIGDTVIFEYVVRDSPDSDSKLPKFTGANDNPASPYYSRAVGVSNLINNGHRWSVAGRLKAPKDSIVIFGFEDDVKGSSDMDFDDVVFETTLSIGHPPIDGSLTFTDSLGLPLPLNSIYTPNRGFLYLTYIDDVPPDIANRTAKLTLTIKNPDGVASDLEVPAQPISTLNGDAAIWKFKIPLAESKTPLANNAIAEAFIKGLVTATLPTHNDLGQVTGNLTTSLIVAYTDVPLQINATPCNPAEGPIVRSTQCVVANVINQPLSVFPDDSIPVTLRCTQTGDQLTTLARKVNTVNGTATYQTGNIPKGEGTSNPNDAVLTCQLADEISATATDPVYSESKTFKTNWTADGPQKIFFALPSNPELPITSTTDGAEGNKVLLVLALLSPNTQIVDKVTIAVAATDGETENFELIETGANTSLFQGLVPFSFIVGSSTPGNTAIEFSLNTTQKTNDGELKASYTYSNGTVKQVAISVVTLFNPVVKAWIKDINGNGAADKVYFQFSTPLTTPPTNFPVYWNDANVIPKMATLVSFLPGSNNTIAVVDFSTSEFEAGKTAAGLNPMAEMPKTNVFGGQKPAIEDSLGPIILNATVKPFDPTRTITNQDPVGQDTIQIVLSEPLKKNTDFAKLLKQSLADKNGQCNSGPTATLVRVDGQPDFSSDQLTLTFLVTQDPNATRVLPGNCLYLNNEGSYVDLKGNIPAPKGTPVTGPIIKPDIETFRGFPPVVGIDVNANDPLTQTIRNSQFQTATNDPKAGNFEDFTQFEGSRYVVKWVPPADWNSNSDVNVMNGYYNNFGKVDHGYIPGTTAAIPGSDQSKEQLLPNNISLVQVVTTSAYIADVSIYDNLGHFVRRFRQAFGYLGEFSNRDRQAPRGFKSYLIWDLHDSKGRRVGQGAYIWKTTFTFDDRSQKIKFTRTGVVRAP
jgi:hypothetical protein